MIEFQTLSGSTYLLDEDHLLIQRVVRSDVSASERVQATWKPYVALGALITVGKPVVIIWGYGRDEHSDSVECIGTELPDEFRTRMTMTSPVTKFRYYTLDA